MRLTKVVVLVAHDDENFNVDDLMGAVEVGVGEHLDRRNAFYEVRNQGTTEMTLGMVDYSLEHREPLEALEPEKTGEQSFSRTRPRTLFSKPARRVTSPT